MHIHNMEGVFGLLFTMHISLFHGIIVVWLECLGVMMS